LSQCFPTAGLQRTAEREFPCGTPRAPPVGFIGLQSIVCRLDPRGIWLPSSADFPSCFHLVLAASSNRPSPDPFESGSFSRASSVPFGVPSPFLLIASFEAKRPARVSALFATSPMVSTRCGSSAPATFRPQVFSTSRRFSPPPTLRACCIPLPRPGFSPFRGFSRFAALLTHRQSVPPCRYHWSAHRQAGCHALVNRLRGFDPRIGAFLGFGV